MADSSSRMGHGCSRTKSHSKLQSPPPPAKTLTRLVAKRNWHEIETILSPNTIEWIEIDEKGIINEDSILQFALRYRAPLYIIKLLALRYPRCLTRPDSTGKYACHVAAKYGAMPNVIEYLVNKNKCAAGVQDPDGKTPIHYVSEFYAINNESGSMEHVFENMLQVVRLLREVAPQTFNLEDHYGCNAIEYAIENDVDIKVIKTMQRTARDDWRAMKEHGKGKSHEEMAKDVERTACEARANAALNDAIGTTGSRLSRRSARPTTDLPELKRSFMAKSA
eukprot:7897_1